MKRKRVAILVAIVIALVLAILYLWGPSSVPAGQAPLTALSNENFGEFVTAFDAFDDDEVPRLVLLLSPT